MARDLQQQKEEIRDRSDILAVIGQYTRLVRAGKNWKGLCPFHSDRNPSFYVNPQGQFYKCFSCGESGDIFTFIQKKENLDFLETMEYLAKRAGIEFERRESTPEAKSEREEMFELNRLAVEYFKERLALSPDAQAYLAKRALLKPTQEQFDIGYAPPDWEGLSFYLQRKGANIPLAIKLGLLKSRAPANNGTYDTFRNRLMFPIHDLNQKVIAFGGRAMGDDPAKYLNSEQSAIFDKSRTLYGLCFARKHLTEKNPPVFVEGYVDVITAHQAGFTQCIATLGTSMTEEHGRLLVRYSPKVIACYDGDAAGIKATLRASAIWESLGVENAEARIARLPAGEDPDSVIKRGDTALFQKALDTAIPRVEYQIELALQSYDLDNMDERGNALKELLSILATISSLVDRDRYIQRYAYLHPTYAYNAGRAIMQIAAEVEEIAVRTKGNISARQQGYPLTEQANRAPLAEQPQGERPPTAPSQVPFPHTREYKGKGQNRRDASRRLSDPSTPSTTLPQMTGAEKVERQILRGLFEADWRSLILSRLTSEQMVTPAGKQLFDRIARTPANAEGQIDKARLLHELEAEEENPNEEDDPFANDHELKERYGLAENSPVKLSITIKDFLEESVSIVSNEPLSEASINDCIRRIGKYNEDRQKQELAQLLQRTDTSAEERAHYLRQYHQKVRELRGLPTPVDTE